MVGAGILLAGLTDLSAWSIPLVFVALADAGTISIEAGLAGAFGVGIVATALLTLVARRLSDGRLIERERVDPG